MLFENRQQAGRRLASRLQSLSWFDRDNGQDCAVIALPRGGVPVAAEIALALGCPLDLLVSKKICAPDNPELAIGAVSSSGVVVLHEQIERFGFDAKELQRAQGKQRTSLMSETRKLEERWIKECGIRQRVDVRGKNIVLVDDGIATGMTTLAALASLKNMKAGHIVLAVPVIPYDTYCRLLAECDFLLALSIPYQFLSVGGFYADFHQVDDKELVAALKQANRIQTKTAG